MLHFIIANSFKNSDAMEAKQDIQLMYESFCKLSYKDRLIYYDHHFGLIPFQFPEMCLHISWFAEEKKLCQLEANFYKENRNKHLLETCLQENGKWCRFDIKPTSPIQRHLYNEYLLFKFTVPEDATRCRIETELNELPNAATFLKQKIYTVHSTIEGIKKVLQNKKMKFSLKHQFLQIVYTGISDYDNLQATVSHRNRRKFVEAYLYSQGTFMAAYLKFLKRFLEEKAQTKLVMFLCVFLSVLGEAMVGSLDGTLLLA